MAPRRDIYPWNLTRKKEHFRERIGMKRICHLFAKNLEELEYSVKNGREVKLKVVREGHKFGRTL